MFDVSPVEVVFLVIVAIILAGPERLPKLAADAGRFFRQVRVWMASAQKDLREGLGPEFQDVRLSELNPRGLMRRHVFDADEYARDIDLDLDDQPTKPARRMQTPLQPGESVPYDSDAT